jgi:hypothetical protein
MSEISTGSDRNWIIHNAWNGISNEAIRIWLAGRRAPFGPFVSNYELGPLRDG